MKSVEKCEELQEGEMNFDNEWTGQWRTGQRKDSRRQETVPPKLEKRLLCEAVPPNRTKELENIRNDIKRIEMEISTQSRPKVGPVPLADIQVLTVGTVPPNCDIRKCTRRKKTGKIDQVRKG